MRWRYAELRPDQLLDCWARNPLAVVPWGALEWHGPHLPLGLDGLVAEHFAERLADQSGGALLPTLWAPITTLPHPFSLQHSTPVVRALFDETISGLYRAGARRIALVTGHYAHGHHVELYEAARRGMDKHKALCVFAGTPLEPLGDRSLLDHAARYETSQLLAIRPELADLEALPPAPSTGTERLNPLDFAVLGENPGLASAAEGRQLLEHGLRAWKAWLATATPDTLEVHYAAALNAYSDYRRDYGQDSWEAGILRWWASQGRKPVSPE